jgi:Tfp pilus assembly protein FimT
MDNTSRSVESVAEEIIEHYRISMTNAWRSGFSLSVSQDASRRAGLPTKQGVINARKHQTGH